MFTEEFQIDELGEGLGQLLLADAGLLVRPPQQGQYHARVPLDTGHFAQVMDLGDVEDGFGDITWHIVSSLTVDEAHKLLDRGWYAYFDGYCMGKVWIDARVCYVGADGKVVKTQGYGFSDGEARGTVYVYCREYWESRGNADPTQSDWADLLSTHVIGSNLIQGPIAFDQVEETLAHGLPYVIDTDVQRIVVARPSSDDLGFTVRGFKLIEAMDYELG
jgi:hypothetical protein